MKKSLNLTAALVSAAMFILMTGCQTNDDSDDNTAMMLYMMQAARTQVAEEMQSYKVEPAVFETGKDYPMQGIYKLSFTSASEGKFTDTTQGTEYPFTYADGVFTTASNPDFTFNQSVAIKAAEDSIAFFAMPFNEKRETIVGKWSGTNTELVVNEDKSGTFKMGDITRNFSTYEKNGPVIKLKMQNDLSHSVYFVNDKVYRFMVTMR